MPTRHVVVDGSNIATEGRSLPSLAQLDEAVQAFQLDYPDTQITVVVDATFGHRIDESERAMLEEAEIHGEVVSPPAGAIGRGDAFLLLIAERTGATVFSNDSFQEFHGEHEWLFDKGRLIGGKPVPSVGWIFTPRTPVRGPKSREAVKDARRNQVRIGSPEASRPMPVPKAPPPGWAPQGEGDAATDGAVAKARPVASGLAKTRVDPKVRKAIEAATKEAEAPDSSAAQRRRRRRGAGPPPQAVNDPLAFITFIAEHRLGDEVEGEVEGFTSHGAFVAVDGATGYVPLSGLGDPPPTKARSVLAKGERRAFVLQALDAQRRGLELALPEFARVSGGPSDETVDAEIAGEMAPEPPKRRRNRVSAASAPVPTPDQPALSQDSSEPETPVPAKRTRRRSTKPEPDPVAVAELVPASDVDTAAAEVSPSAAGSGKAAPTRKPAARRTRRPATPPAEVPPPAAEVPPPAAEVPPPAAEVPPPAAESAPAVPTEPTKPTKPAARRTRRPAAPPVPGAEDAAPAEPVPADPAAPTPAADDAAPTRKPTARRTRRPAAPPAEVPPAEVPPAEVPPPAAESAPAVPNNGAAPTRKPAARRTRRPAAPRIEHDSDPVDQQA